MQASLWGLMVFLQLLCCVRLQQPAYSGFWLALIRWGFDCPSSCLLSGSMCSIRTRVPLPGCSAGAWQQPQGHKLLPYSRVILSVSVHASEPPVLMPALRSCRELRATRQSMQCLAP